MHAYARCKDVTLQAVLESTATASTCTLTHASKTSLILLLNVCGVCDDLNEAFEGRHAFKALEAIGTQNDHFLGCTAKHNLLKSCHFSKPSYTHMNSCTWLCTLDLHYSHAP